MSDKSLFRRNLVIIVTLHLLLVGIFFLSGLFPRHPDTSEVDGGSSAPQASQSNDTESTPEETAPESSPQKSLEDSGTSAPSMIVLGTPAPSPSATPTPRRTPTPKPTPTPRPATPTPTPTVAPTTPKRSPHPSATARKSPSRSPSPKASAKKSASPKTSPKHSASPSESPKPSADETANNTEEGTETTSGTALGTKSKPGAHPGEGGGNRGGSGHQGGAEKAAQINWYNNMIHDRILSRWVNPTSDPTLSALVKIRIEKDGHVSAVTLQKSSGNPQMDESAMMAAKSVTQFDPLPSAIDDSFYDVPIEFKPTSD